MIVSDGHKVIELLLRIVAPVAIQIAMDERPVDLGSVAVEEPVMSSRGHVA
jgi:hypothetical protein